MGRTTTYRVELIYNLKGNAGAGLKGITREAERARSGLGGLRSLVLGGLGLGAFAAGKKYLYDYNVEINRMKIGMATVISMNFGKPFEAGAKASDKMFENFQRMAMQSPATTKDYVTMANMISSAVLSSGKGLKDLETITNGAINAAAALGATGEQQTSMFARDISQLAMGKVTAVDRYARQLLRGIGYTDYTKYNKDVKSGKVNAGDMTLKALTTPQIEGASKAFGSSTEGVMSTFKDNLEITFAKIGLPMVQAITKEVKSWNDWISANPEKIAAIGTKLANGLKEAFSIIKDIVKAIFPLIKDVFGVVQSVLQFASEHRETIIGLIKALLVYKGLQMGGGLLMGMGKGIMARGDKFKELGSAISGLVTGTSGLRAGFGSLIGALTGGGGVISSVALLGGAAYTAYKFLTSKTESEKRAIAKADVQIKSAKDFQKTRDEYANMMARRAMFPEALDQKFAEAAGISDSQLEGTKAAMDAYAEKMISEMQGMGIAQEEISGGKRKVTFKAMTGGMTGSEDIDVFRKMGSAAQEMWKSAIMISEYYQSMGQGKAGNLNDLTATFNWLGYMVQDIAAKQDEGVEDLYGQMPLPTKPKVDVTINKIEVSSDDPDRFVHGAVSAFSEIVRNPTQAADALRGGF